METSRPAAADLACCPPSALAIRVAACGAAARVAPITAHQPDVGKLL
jgi:hypothetical protein